MKIILIVPRVVEKYLSRFPEYSLNAYPYFNYDHRVVDERVNRGDAPSTYKGPDEFCDADYDALLMHAGTLLNPTLQGFNPRVAAEDALNLAIRSYANGRFDGKVNANKFEVLAAALAAKAGVRLAASKKKAPKAGPQKVLTKRVQRMLGVSPKSLSRSKSPAKATKLVWQPGGNIAIMGPQRVASNFAQQSHSFEGGSPMVKNAQQYTERLDKVAEEIQASAPEVAMQLDIVSDILEGKRTATTIQFDADEARFMAGRFNFNVRQREADEPYMDSFNQSNFEQVTGARKNPTPVKLAYQKVQQ